MLTTLYLVFPMPTLVICQCDGRPIHLIQPVQCSAMNVKSHNNIFILSMLLRRGLTMNGRVLFRLIYVWFVFTLSIYLNVTQRI